jgi:murein DD-endopeptidase MepM/ murein hydrolase activator NlpD
MEKKRGLLDLCASGMAVYVMIVATPAGGLVIRAFNRITGAHTATKDLASYFDSSGGSKSGGATAAPIIAHAIAEPLKLDAEETFARDRLGISAELSRGVSIMLSGGKQTADGHFDISLPPAAHGSFAAVGVSEPPRAASADVREKKLFEGLAKLRARLQSDEAAVAACAVDVGLVEFAVESARAAGEPSPGLLQSFRAYLPPGDREEADALVDGTFALAIAFDMRWPVDPGSPISSPFGYREHPVLGRREMHPGTDIAVGTGTQIHAIARGHVLYATSDAVNGRFVKIDHGHGLTSAYCHASELRVIRGVDVGKGDLVMLSGATGRATGPHLHLQMEINGKPIDPEIFLRVHATAASIGGRHPRNPKAI